MKIGPHSYWEASNVGALLMLAGGLLTAYVAVQYFNVEYLQAGILASVVAILIGFVWNTIAAMCSWKKVHWLDFVLSLIPWW
jgi:hypothetical protein